MWLDSGDTSSFKTYEDFEAAVKRQLDYLIDVNCRGTVIIEKVFRDVSPTPFMSLFVDGCMEKGRDVMDGGAVLYAYHFFLPNPITIKHKFLSIIYKFI